MQASSCSKIESNTRLRFADVGVCEKQDTGSGVKVWGHPVSAWRIIMGAKLYRSAGASGSGIVVERGRISKAGLRQPL